MKRLLLLFGAAGLAVAIWLYLRHGAGDIVQAVTALGWGLAGIALWRVVPIALDATGWWSLFAPQRRPPLFTTCWIRWISESANALLPVAQIGGEVVRSRLLGLRRIVPTPEIGAAEAGGTVVVDLTIGIVATIVFSAAGALLLVGRTTGPPVDGALWGIFGLLLLLALFAIVQRYGWLGGGVRWVTGRIGGRLSEAIADGSRQFDRTVAETWRHWRRPLAGTAWRIAASFATAGEIWLALWLMGHPVTLADAVMLESLTFAVRTAAFVVPGALGVQEGALLLLGGLVGLAAETALALALVKRVRELAVGVPALAAWWLAEGRARLPARS